MVSAQGWPRAVLAKKKTQMMGIFDFNFWSLTCGSPCSLWNHLDHLLDHLLPPGQKQFCACHVPPSPRHVSQTLHPNKVSPEQQFGISPHFTSPHLTTSLQFPCPPQIPRIFPLLSPSSRGYQARTLLSSTSCVAAWSREKENATLKPSPPTSF